MPDVRPEPEILTCEMSVEQWAFRDRTRAEFMEGIDEHLGRVMQDMREAWEMKFDEKLKESNESRKESP